MKHSLENTIPEVYVNISNNSIYSTVENYPKMFKWEEENIEKVINSDSFFEDDFVNRCFNVDLDNSVRDQVISLLEESAIY